MRPEQDFYVGLGVALVLSFVFVWLPIAIGLYLRYRS